MQRKKCKINKLAAPIFFPFLLDGLGSREVVVKTARVYRVNLKIIFNFNCFFLNCICLFYPKMFFIFLEFYLFTLKCS